MDTWTWVLLGIGLYWLLLVFLRQSGVLPSSVGTMGPLVTLHTQRGKDFLDWLARPKRAWRAYANFGLGGAMVVLVGAFLLLVVQAVNVLVNPPAPSAITQPRNVLVIPGVNQFLPLAVAPEILFGLLVGLVVHEGGHGILCRVEDIDVESMGVVLLAVLPVGAFVEPDEESQQAADRGSRSRMFAAGVTNNFLITALALALLFGPVTGSIAVAPGAHVGSTLPGSPAADAGIEKGDRLVAVAGHDIQSNEDLRDTLLNVSDRTVSVELASGRTTTVTRSLLVTGVVQKTSPLAAIPVNQSDPTTIVAVNGTEVHTEPALRDAVRDRPVATLRTADGQTVTAPMGALVVTVPDSPFATQTDLGANTHLVLTRVNGERVLGPEDVTAALDGTEPGQQVSLVGYVDGERRTFSVSLGDRSGDQGGFLGVQAYPGLSGMSVTDFGVEFYPAETFLDMLGGDGGGNFAQNVFQVLVLPFIGVVAGLPFNFAGFVAPWTNFFVVEGPLAPLGGFVFILANLLFWTGWVNLNLGFFNCIPAFPLDGGHLLRMSAEGVVSRLPIEDRRQAVRTVTTSVGLLMLVSLLLMVFGPELLN
ncbi:site-2 protease family protein [Halospeciosus flavus]|uniref:Site-2 protease family protein n=1 Tax=Halospeciosus flavus TaxID=3032283 RepID=A0ABD5Z8L7_9EURY|nr:site-2 protease family protein [Halospeciosus flavus]